MADNGCDELDHLMTDLRVQVPGVTDALIRLELFNAVNSFCRRTNAWRYEAEVALQRGETQYPVFPPSGTTLVRVLSALHNGRPLSQDEGGFGDLVGQSGRLVADEVLGDGDSIYDADEVITEGMASRYAVYYPTYVTIDVPPSTDVTLYPLKIVMAITLDRSCCCDGVTTDACDWALDEWMYQRYFDEWKAATLANLYGYPNKPWSNPPLAMFWGKKARAGQNFARQEADRGMVYGAKRWRFPRGFA